MKSLLFIGGTGFLGQSFFDCIRDGKLKNLKLSKIIIVSRKTKSLAYSMKKVSFEENKTFNKSNVERFINYHKKKLRS